MKKDLTTVVMLAGVIALLSPTLAFATTGGAGIPELSTSLGKLRDTFTGPIAGAISLIGIVTTGAMLVFGGELNEFSRRGVFMVLVISIIVGASTLLTGVFGASASVM